MDKGKLIRRGVAAAAMGAALAVVPVMAPAAQAHAVAIPRVFVTVLTGEQSVPPADLDGIAIAVVRVDTNKDQVCYFLAQAKLDPVTAAHIHRGAKGVNGPVVVPFVAPVDGTSSGCTAVAPALADELAQTPQNFYVNIHSTVFPAGAVRGQLP